MQNFEVTNKEHYGMLWYLLWYFLEWSIKCALFHSMKLYIAKCVEIKLA